MTAIQPDHVRELQRHLQEKIACDVRTDPYSRILYSTDASIYQVEPLGVAYPRSAEDVAAIVAAAASLHVPLIPRGSGTSLSGQAIGPGLVIDLSRHMRRIVRLGAKTCVAEVEAGVVGHDLNRAAKADHLMFGPDPASADRATIGGMIGNNAAGAHSICYGMTADHLVAVEAILSDGSLARFEPVSEARAQQLAGGPSLEGRIYQAALRIRAEAAAAVRAHWPATWRRSSGYSLDYLVGYHASRPPGWFAEPIPYPPDRGFNLAPLLCSAEGTLAIVTRATVNLVPRPAATVLVILPFESIVEACEATPDILTTRPTAVELIPRSLIKRAASVPAYARRITFVEGDPAALLAVEYTGETHPAALAAGAPLAKRGWLLDSPQAQADLWDVRNAGLGLLLSVPGDVKPVSFIEDVTVPVERLDEYVRRVDQLLADQGTWGEWYAHASAGCLHLRPLLNLRNAEGVAKMRAIAEAILDIVIDMKGVLTSEHGDGLAHTEFNARLFGPEIMAAFHDLKRAFDPQGLLNPGKIVSPTSDPPPMDTSLRYGPGYGTLRIDSVYAFRREGDLAHAVEECNGAGLCLQSSGVMCPSYQAAREEMYTTRGRANALRAALSGRLPPGSLTSRQMYEVLDLCLMCKGCKAECPSAVDMARLKGEFLELYYAEHGVPLRSRLFAEIAAVSRAVRPLAPLANALAATGSARWLLEKTLRISRRRRLPAFAHRSFRQWFSRRQGAAGGEPVVLFVDTFVDSNHPEVGQAAVRVLEAAGCQVQIVKDQVCCGRAMISKGLLRKAKRLAGRNIEALAATVKQGIPIILLEPSCHAALRDEYLDFFPDDPRAARLADGTFLIEEFLLQTGPDGRRRIDRLQFDAVASKWVLHGHCHAKALAGTRPTIDMLRATGASVEEIDAGCCGMAGSFGYEKEHFDLSMQIGELRLFPAVRQAARQGATALASGSSCRAQILDGTGIRAMHPIEALAGVLAAPQAAGPPG